MDLYTAKSDSAGGTKSDSDNFPSQCPTYPSGTSPSLPPQIIFLQRNPEINAGSSFLRNHIHSIHGIR